MVKAVITCVMKGDDKVNFFKSVSVVINASIQVIVEMLRCSAVCYYGEVEY